MREVPLLFGSSTIREATQPTNSHFLVPVEAVLGPVVRSWFLFESVIRYSYQEAGCTLASLPPTEEILERCKTKTYDRDNSDEPQNPNARTL